MSGICDVPVDMCITYPETIQADETINDEVWNLYERFYKSFLPDDKLVVNS